jgi:hypothetical protein
VASDQQRRVVPGPFPKGAMFERKKWNAQRADWDHDHCSYCWAKFGEWDAPEIKHEGYTTTDAHGHDPGYQWVCEACFAELRNEMGWVLAPTRESGHEGPKPQLAIYNAANTAAA